MLPIFEHFHLCALILRNVQNFTKLYRDNENFFSSVCWCKIHLYELNFSKIFYLLPSEISVGNKCPNCKYQRCFISCCQKFLRATKITFSRSLILEDCFCTLGRFQNLTNRSVPHLQSFVNSDKKEPKSKIYTKNAFSQNYRHRERK